MAKLESFRIAGAVSRRLARQESTEHTLLVRVARKEQSALADVYERFQRPLFSYLFHLLGQKEL